MSFAATQRSGTIYSDPFEVLREAGFTPHNFYVHPAYRSPAGYIPVWHLVQGTKNQEMDLTMEVSR